MTDVVNPKSASPDQLLPYHKKISAEGKALMICFISYTYMVLKRASICGKIKVFEAINNTNKGALYEYCKHLIIKKQ